MAKQALLFNDTSLAGNHGSTLAVQQIRQLAGDANIDVVMSCSASFDLSKLPKRNLDLILVNGEGSLHGNRPAAKAIADVPAWARSRDLPCFLVNSIYQDNDEAIARSVQGFDKVFLRDPRSFEVLARTGVAPDGVVDVAMTWTPGSTLPQEGTLIAVTDASGKKDNKALYAFACGDEGRHFLPFRSLPAPWPGSVDTPWSRAFKFHLRRGISTFQPMSLNRDRYGHAIAHFAEFVHWLRDNARGMVTGRYHGLCLAACLQIPFLALTSQSHKTESLLEEIGLEGRAVCAADLQALDDEELNTAMNLSPMEVERIETFVRTQLEAGRQMFKDIAALS